MKPNARHAVRVLGLCLVLCSFRAEVWAQYNPGSTVDLGQVGVGTSSRETLVVLYRQFPGANNTVAIVVGGQGFTRGRSSTCPTFQNFVSKDCIVTVAFAPTSLGAKTGQVVASFALCGFSACPNETWTLKGTGVVSKCDVNKDLKINVSDVQLIVNQALGVSPPVTDLNNDGRVNVVDVQLLINAVLGRGCGPQSP